MDNLSKPAVAPVPAADTATSTLASREVAVGDNTNIDLYMTYNMDHDIPFVADYYGIGDMMGYKDLSYADEITTIDNYLVDEVRGQRLANSTDAVKNALRGLEKLAGVDKNTPTSIRVKQLAAYSEFLRKANEIKKGIN